MRYALLIVLTIILAALPAHAQRAWETPGEASAARARQLAGNDRCSEALEAFDRAIVHRAHDATLRRDRGRCHERLGHRQPAIEDYRAYLSMAPDAPDAGRVRSRLSALEAQEEQSAPLAPAEPFDPASPEPEDDEPAAFSQAGLFGAHLGVRDWNDRGFPGATWSIGVEGGFSYHPYFEVDLRLALLTTGESDASGGGVSLAHTFRLPFGPADQFEALVAIGGGYEQQENDLRVTRRFWFGRLSPSFRWNFHEAVLLQAGPEFGLGAIPPPDEVPEETETETAVYWGGRAELLWVIR